MNVKDYLKQIKLLDIKINQRMMEKNDLESIAIKYPGIQEHCEELAAGIDKVISDMVNQKDCIIGQIMQLKGYRYSDVLFLHYVKYMQLEEIAEWLVKSNGKGYTWNHINFVHGNALKELQTLLQ